MFAGKDTHSERVAAYAVGLAKALALGSFLIERIRLAARLHDMTADRPYRAALSHRQARHELARGPGTQFDQSLVTAFLGHTPADGRFVRNSATLERRSPLG